MRRKPGIAVGVCAALVLSGTAGAVAWNYSGDDDGRPVGTWHEAPGIARTAASLSEAQQDAGGGPTAAPGATGSKARAASQREAAPAPQRRSTAESAEEVAEKGRQKVGELLEINRLLGYVNAPRRETFHYPGASYVKLHFSRMMLLPGDYLTVSDPSGEESYRYDAAGVLNPEQADKWAMSITGDTAILEMHRAADPLGVTSLLGNLGVQVDQVARGFSRSELQSAPEESLHAPGRTGREESVCGGDDSTDAVCYRSTDPVAYTRSKAIARLLIDGTELCTGWRVGANNRMLTNNHCFDSSDDAYDTEVWFNYQCARCGGYDVFKPTKVWGDKVIATHRTYDFTLFSVENFAAIQKFGYLTLDTARPAKDQQLYVPQHPAGEPARIAGAKGGRAGNCAVADNAYDGYATDSDVSYFCDTEGGSSGSPVLARNTDKVVALHHFGGCPNSGVRADLLYARLKSLL